MNVYLQIWFNEAMRRVLVEKDRQLENLRMHSVHVESECQKHRETIHRLTGTSGLVPTDELLLSSLIEVIKILHTYFKLHTSSCDQRHQRKNILSIFLIKFTTFL